MPEVKQRAEIMDYYDKHVAPMIERYRGMGDSPEVVLRMSVAGHAVTKSDIEHFKDCIQCYDYILNQEIQAKGAGATSPGTIVAEPVVFYIPFDAEVKLFENFVGKSIFDEINLMLFSETKEKRTGYLEFIMKAARMNFSPIKFGNNCYALSMTYEDYSVKRMRIDPETGAKEGVEEANSVNLRTGERRKG